MFGRQGGLTYRRANGSTALAVGLLLACAGLAGCSNSERASQGFSPSFTGTPASPRVYAGVGAVPRRQGVYKVGKPYTVAGQTFVPRHDPGYDRTGIASWYGDDFHGRLTANGEVFDMNRPTAAHPTLPLPSLVRVTNLDNGRSMVVRVNDRGPFLKGRIIDLSRASAARLGFVDRGTARVRVTYVGAAALDG